MHFGTHLVLESSFGGSQATPWHQKTSLMISMWPSHHQGSLGAETPSSLKLKMQTRGTSCEFLGWKCHWPVPNPCHHHSTLNPKPSTWAAGACLGSQQGCTDPAFHEYSPQQHPLILHLWCSGAQAKLFNPKVLVAGWELDLGVHWWPWVSNLEPKWHQSGAQLYPGCSKKGKMQKKLRNHRAL